MAKRLAILMTAWLAVGAAFGADAPAPAAPPPPPPVPSPNDIQQVEVSVKVVEFQTGKGVETGLSAYFAQREEERDYGWIEHTTADLTAADITFPTSTNSGITVFLDQIHLPEGDLEVVLQALVDEDRAFILSQPKTMVTVGSPVPSTIQTTQQIPYENTVVVGATAMQTTAFRDTGVSLTVSAPEVIDDDGNWATNDDTYIKLLVSAAVNEEGQRIVIALDDKYSATGIYGSASNAIKVPEFVSRSVATSVWVRHGQVLLLGGLFRNTKNKNLSTLPWLTQGEDTIMGLAQRIIPGGYIGSPVSASIGNRSTNEARRELVFLIKAEFWRPSYTVMRDFNRPAAETDKKASLTEAFSEISKIPQGLVEGIAGPAPEESSIDANLGGDK